MTSHSHEIDPQLHVFHIKKPTTVERRDLAVAHPGQEIVVVSQLNYS